MSDWLQWNLSGSFRVQIPADAQTRLDDDGTTAVIRCGTGEEVTEVLMSNFPLEKPTPDTTALAEELQDIARGFFSRAVHHAVGHAVPFDVHFAEDPELELYYAEGISVLEKGGGQIWVARFYGRPGMSRFWIVHWNGLKKNLETIMRVLVSFEPDESSFS